MEGEMTGEVLEGNLVLENVNNDVLLTSKYGDDHRIIGVLVKKGGMEMTDRQGLLPLSFHMHKELVFLIY